MRRSSLINKLLHRSGQIMLDTTLGMALSVGVIGTTAVVATRSIDNLRENQAMVQSYKSERYLRKTLETYCQVVLEGKQLDTNLTELVRPLSASQNEVLVSTAADFELAAGYSVTQIQAMSGPAQPAPTGVNIYAGKVEIRMTPKNGVGVDKVIDLPIRYTEDGSGNITACVAGNDPGLKVSCLEIPLPASCSMDFMAGVHAAIGCISWHSNHEVCHAKRYAHIPHFAYSSPFVLLAVGGAVSKHTIPYVGEGHTTLTPTLFTDLAEKGVIKGGHAPIGTHGLDVYPSP